MFLKGHWWVHIFGIIHCAHSCWIKFIYFCTVQWLVLLLSKVYPVFLCSRSSSACRQCTTAASPPRWMTRACTQMEWQVQGIVKCFLFHLRLLCYEFQVANSLSGEHHSKICVHLFCFFDIFLHWCEKNEDGKNLLVVCNNLLHILTFLSILSEFGSKSAAIPYVTFVMLDPLHNMWVGAYL